MKPFVILLALGPLLAAGRADDAPRVLLPDWMAKMRAIVPPGYVCVRAKSAPKIDGKLDDAAWAAAAWTQDFVDIEGAAKPTPRWRTRAKMLWDDQFFYVAADLEEPHVWGTLTKHDAVIFQDPDFEVFIDPNGDSHEYYEFEMNALNTGWDLFLPKPYKDGGSAQNDWEIQGLMTAVHVRGTINDPTDRDEGWSVEIAIPWKVLAEYAHRPAPPQNGDQWRVGFSRVEWEIEAKDGAYAKVPKTPEHNWVWSPQGVVDMHRPERWGFVQFNDEASEFLRDPSAPVRDALQTVYYAQKDFHSKHGRWAAAMKELGLTDEPSTILSPPRLQSTAEGFECTVSLTLPDGKPQTWGIHQDSLIKPIDAP